MACCTTDVPVPYDDGNIVPRRANGDCWHLDRSIPGCNIYETRPKHCREFDCRVTAIMWASLDAEAQQKFRDEIGSDVDKILDAAREIEGG